MQRGGFVSRSKCPKCGGNVFLDSDLFGWYEGCLQCGYTRNLQKIVKFGNEAVEKYVETLSEIPAQKL
jgi:predicted nucleic-acid-binding Zn-ribbon protein